MNRGDSIYKDSGTLDITLIHKNGEQSLYVFDCNEYKCECENTNHRQKR
jgi:hypothetical protein